MGNEKFFYSFKVLLSEGYFKVAGNPYEKKRTANGAGQDGSMTDGQDASLEVDQAESAFGADILEVLKGLRKGMSLPVKSLTIKEGEDFSAEALQFRFDDPCDGKCRTAYRR